MDLKVKMGDSGYCYHACGHLRRLGRGRLEGEGSDGRALVVTSDSASDRGWEVGLTLG